MKTYQSHKIVQAAKIISWSYGIDDQYGIINLTDENGLIHQHSKDLFARGEPKDDYFYLVKYDDNYVSWSPKEAFEEGYHEVYQEHYDLNISQAIQAMKNGKKVAREGWNGSDMFAYYVPANKYPAGQNPNGTMKGLFPEDLVPYREYLALKTAQNDIVTWTPSTSDVLANDWYVVD